MAEGARNLRAKLLNHAPKAVCFNGMGIYDAFLAAWDEIAPSNGKRRKITPGLQPERLGESLLFVVPSSSGRTAAYPRQAKLDYYRELKRLLDALPAEATR